MIYSLIVFVKLNSSWKNVLSQSENITSELQIGQIAFSCTFSKIASDKMFGMTRMD